MVARGEFACALLAVILLHPDFRGDLFRCSGYNYSFQELHPQPLLGEIITGVCGKEHPLPLEILWRHPFLLLMSAFFSYSFSSKAYLPGFLGYPKDCIQLMTKQHLAVL